MNNYNVWQLAAALDQIREFECEMNTRAMLGPAIAVQPAKVQQISTFVPYWRKQFEAVELQSALERIDKISIWLRDGVSNQTLAMELRVLLEAVQSELQYRRFAFVPNEKAKLLDGRDRNWGLLWGKIPAIKTDAEEAVNCYALGRNTACVYHLMRVSEHGLRALARKVPVKLTDKGKPHPIEFADWEKVITEVKNKTEAARKLPHGPKRAQVLQFYSDAADHCLYMKELRNSISHARNDYNDAEALGVMERVRGFMEFLAKGL